MCWLEDVHFIVCNELYVMMSLVAATEWVISWSKAVKAH